MIGAIMINEPYFPCTDAAVYTIVWCCRLSTEFAPTSFNGTSLLLFFLGVNVSP
jgi:hypothetical protein